MFLLTMFYVFIKQCSSTEDLRTLNDKLLEVSAAKMQLQLKLDELEASEVSIKVFEVF